MVFSWTRPLLSTLVFKVQRHLPASSLTTVRHLTASMPSDLQEEIADRYGSVVAFMKRYPTDFNVYQQGDGSWVARSVAPVVDRLALQVGCRATLDPSMADARAAARQRPGGPRIVGRRAPPPPLVACPAWEYYGWSPTAPSAVEGDAAQLATDLIVRDLTTNVADKFLVQHPVTGVLWVAARTRHIPPTASGVVKSVEVLGPQGVVAVASYDTLRLARLLSAEHYTDISTLEAASTAYLTARVCTVALSVPDRFGLELCEIDEVLLAAPRLAGVGLHSGAAGREDAGSACDAEEAARRLGAFQKRVADALPPTAKPQQLVGVKYTVDSPLGRSEKLSKMSVDELNDYLEGLTAHKKKRRLAFQADRRAVRREFLSRQFPFGNPYFDEDVAAMFIYDLLQDELRALDFGELLVKIEAAGMPIPPTTITFLSKFPHLFRLEELNPGQFSISRQGSGFGSDAFALMNREISAEAALMELAMAVTLVTGKHEDPVTISASMVQMSLRRPVRAALHRHFGGFSVALDRFPEYFTRFYPSAGVPGGRVGGAECLDIHKSTHAQVNAFAKACVAALEKAGGQATHPQ